MTDPRNNIETIYPCFLEMKEYLGRIHNFEYSESEHDELAYMLYERVKQEVLTHLQSCDAMDAHNQSHCKISFITKKIMCIQLYIVRFLSRVNTTDKQAVVRNPDLHKPWCMQEWLLPGMGILGNAFSARFEPSTLIQSLRKQAEDLGINADENTFVRCYAATADIFCEFLFMHLLVKHESLSTEQIIRNYLKYQSAYEKYACRQWLAQHEAGGTRTVLIPLTAEDLVRIDKVRV